MKELVEVIAKSLVENPDEVVVTETEKEDAIIVELKVGPADMGKVIGQMCIRDRLVEMGCSAFTLKNARITVGFTQDAQGHIFIDRCKLGMAVTEKKEIGKAAKQK